MVSMHIQFVENPKKQVEMTIHISCDGNVTSRETAQMNWVMDMISSDSNTEMIGREEMTIQ